MRDMSGHWDLVVLHYVRWPMHHVTDRPVAFGDARHWAQFHGLKDEAMSPLIEAGGVAEQFGWPADVALGARVAADPKPTADEPLRRPLQDATTSP